MNTLIFYRICEHNVFTCKMCVKPSSGFETVCEHGLQRCERCDYLTEVLVRHFSKLWGETESVKKQRSVLAEQCRLMEKDIDAYCACVNNSTKT